MEERALLPSTGSVGVSADKQTSSEPSVGRIRPFSSSWTPKHDVHVVFWEVWGTN